jgi:uncharacterized protein Yka (UPF0111/DUF47 family)
MNKYWNEISITHQNKLQSLANQHGVTADQALGDIVNYLKKEWDTASCPYYLKELKEIKDIERMIDMITQ